MYVWTVVKMSLFTLYCTMYKLCTYAQMSCDIR